MYRYRFLFLFLFCLLAACKDDRLQGSYEKILPALRYGDPPGTYSLLQLAAPEVVDSAYNIILTSLTDSNKYDLIRRHLDYYGQLEGKRPRAAALIAKSEGWVLNYLCLYDSSNMSFTKAIRLYSGLNRPADMGECYYGKAINYMFLGNYAEIFRNDFKALALYEQLKDSVNIYKVKIEIANGYFFQNEFEEAISTALECHDYYRRMGDQRLLAYSKSILSKVYYKMGDYQKGLEYSQAALVIRRRIGDLIGIGGSLNNISAAYLGLKQWDKALQGFEESLLITQSLGDKRQEPIIRQNIANCLWRMGRKQEAETMLLAIIDTARQHKEAAIVTNAYRLLSALNKEQMQYETALHYHELYKAFSDTLYNYEKAQAINELAVKYETNKKEARIAQLDSERRLNAIQKFLYLSILLFTLAAGGLVILFLRNRNKKNQLVLEKVSMELETNVRELHLFTERIIGKNKLIEELEERLQASERNAEQASLQEANKEQLSQLYQLKILTEEDWRNFKILFDKVYPGFINKLRVQYPDLAPAEERQFLLIRLNIDNKESAAMLGISADSVKKNRYRLKKRFQLTEQENLDDFVRSFT